MEALFIVSAIAGILGIPLAIYLYFKVRKEPVKPPYPPPPPEQGIYVLPPKNTNFTGRGDVLGRLDEILSETGLESVTQAIVGLGGVGKTQIAIEYAHRNIENYELIAWIRAEETETLLVDFANLAHAMRVPGVGGMSPDDLVGAVHVALAERDAWLLVFDNAEEPESIRPYIPLLGRGHILVTSRNPNWRSITTPIELSSFEREESIEFLVKRSGDTDQGGAGAVAEALGDLPLALEQAGAYVEQATVITLTRYAKLFSERHEELWRNQTPPDAYHATVATTWSLAIDKLGKKSPASVELMKLVSFLAANDIPVWLLTEGKEAFREPLRSAVSDEIALSRTLGALRSQSLVTQVAESISVHRLVQTVVQDDLPETERDTWIETALRLLRRVHHFQHDDPETWKRCEQLLPHIDAAVGHAEERGLAREAVAYLLNDAGSYLRTLSSFSLAKEYHERALKIEEAVYGPDHPTVAAVANNLGMVLRNLGDFEGAKEAHEQALKIAETVYGPDNWNVAAIVNGLGMVLRDLGDYEGAKAAYEKALKIGEAVYGPDHPSVASYVNNLGIVLRDLGDSEGAKEAFKRALMINEKVYGPDHLSVASYVNNLGSALQDLGDYNGAKEAYERSLKIDEVVYGPDHPSVATRLNNLGMVLQDLGDFKGAKTACERSLKIDETVYGPDHPSVAIRLNNLGKVLRDLGDDEGAKAAHEKALAIAEIVYGSDHPTTQTFRRNLRLTD